VKPFYTTEITKMAVTYRVLQMHDGGNHSCIFIEDNVSQRKLGTGVYDPARAQFAFIPTDHDIQFSAADQASIVSIRNSLSR